MKLWVSCRVGIRVQGLGFRVQDLGFKGLDSTKHSSPLKPKRVPGSLTAAQVAA